MPPSARRLVTHHVMCVDMRRAARQEEGRGNQGLFSSRSPNGLPFPLPQCHTPVLEYVRHDRDEQRIQARGDVTFVCLRWGGCLRGVRSMGCCWNRGRRRRTTQARGSHTLPYPAVTAPWPGLPYPRVAGAVHAPLSSMLSCSRSRSHCRFLPVTEANAWKNPEKG